MTDLFDVTAKITLDTSAYDQGIDSASEKANVFAGMLEANLATKAIGLAVEGFKKLGQAAVDTFQAAVSGYADYEQLAGGVETLFKSSADTVMQYADQAFQSAGLSANAYMETVTSFSAALISSLGGDTDAAAQLANQAIIDMSDNANKMGTDMASIQNAYQGFAKQNYTMLDNLKLGYGGTQAEMERLIQDAERLDESFQVVHNKTKKGNDEMVYSFGDVVQAIHIVQENMDITGTTAKEASNTISGSVAQMKAAWSNLIAGLGNDQADLDKLIDEFFDSAERAWDNFAPVAERVIDSMFDAFEKAIPKFLDLGVKIGRQILEGLLSIISKPIKWFNDITGISNLASGLLGRASGGPVSANQAYKVGEFGTEIFVPNTNGRIYSTGDSEAMTGGGITINIQGDIYDDERSMRQKLKSAMLSVLQEQVAYG